MDDGWGGHSTSSSSSLFSLSFIPAIAWVKYLFIFTLVFIHFALFYFYFFSPIILTPLSPPLSSRVILFPFFIRPRANGSTSDGEDGGVDRSPTDIAVPTHTRPSHDPQRLIKQTYSVIVTLPQDRERKVTRKWHLSEYCLLYFFVFLGGCE